MNVGGLLLKSTSLQGSAGVSSPSLWLYRGGGAERGEKLNYEEQIQLIWYNVGWLLNHWEWEAGLWFCRLNEDEA